MIRYGLMCFLLAGALVVERMVASFPHIGFLAPNCGLLFIMVYAIKSSGEDFWILCLFSGIVKGSLSFEPAGFYVIMYSIITMLVLKVRSLLFVELPVTQIVLVVLSGVFIEAGYLLAHVLHLLPGDRSSGELLLPLCSSAVAAYLTPFAMRVYERSKLIQALFRP